MAHKSIEKVAVVIPNLNGEKHLAVAIDSLMSQTHSLELIVVDNASTDASLEMLKKYEDKIILLKNQKNLGFAGGVNCGIKYALEHSFDAVALFNNDAVAESNWLEKLVQCMNEHDDVGIVTCSLQLMGGEKLDSTGEFYTSWGLPYPRGRGADKHKFLDGGFVFGASGGASLYRSKTLSEIGLFDEAFFAYYEDADISFRAQLAGWKVYFEPKAVAYHAIGQTSNRMGSGFSVYQTFKNLPLLYTKNVPGPLLLPIGLRFYSAYWLMVGRAVVRGRGLAALKGVGASIGLGLGALSKRRYIQRTKKVSTEYINNLIVHDLPPDQTGLRKLRKVFIGK